MSNKIRIAGSGGQGILIAGVILGKAASVYDGKWATQTQSYGPEARGGASKTDVIISSTEINYPFISECDVLVCLSQLAYTKYGADVTESGMRIIDPDMVVAHNGDGIPIPASSAAESLGSPLVANMVMLGALAELYGTVSIDALEKAIESTVSKRFVELDILAVRKGVELAQDYRSEQGE
jgi:2-oxoglutarate ferredoxin oxidoreductase subunit gamma